MVSRYRWRNISVFLSFNEDSSVGLLIGQQLGRQSIAVCDKAIRGLQDDPAQLEQELLFHSNANTSLWIEYNSGMLLRPLPALLLAIFATVMVVVNRWITAMGMGVEFGWLDHLFLALSEVALTVFFLMAPEPAPISEP